MASLTSDFLNYLSEIPDSPKDPEDLVVLPKYWNRLSNLALFWNRREACPQCGWNGNPEQLLRVSIPQEGQRVIFRRSENLKCVCCKIIDLLIQRQQGLDTNRWTLSLWMNQDKPCVRLEDSLFEEDDIGWNFFILEPRGRNLSGIPRGSLVSGNTASDAAYEWAKCQLSICYESHQRCNTQGVPFLPTRLISITGGNDDVRLVDNFDVPPPAQYVALSHCWGKKLPECITTRENILDQRRNIPWNSLPKSFQEAVIFTRRLGIDYLWIDSICIIQQEPEDWTDWLREAPLMFHVYRNAVLTLAASHAEDSSKGLFSNLDPGRQLQLGTIQHGNEKFQLYAQQSFADTTNLYLYHRSEPLFKRAWTFQERLVSPRILYFTKDELVWECYSTTTCECGFHGHGPYTPTSLKIQQINNVVKGTPALHNRLDHIKYLAESLFARAGKEKDLSGVEVEKTWRRIVQFYSELQLTNETDRLLAIGAIGEQTQAIRRNQTYLAGLWSESLGLDLLWVSKRRTGSQRQPSELYIAPTWSWASAPGPVDYSWTSPVKPNIEVLEASCKYYNDNQFGKAMEGRLVLRGQAITCTLHRLLQDSSPSYRVEHLDLAFDVDVSIDHDPFSKPGDGVMTVHLLRVADASDFPTPINMILKESSSRSNEVLYVRVGMVLPPGTRIQDQDERRKLKEWFNGCSETRTYTVV
ncbi:HET-domain-containing protein [Hypoxylon sp. FL1857]|nr:HET-domain-containing protein [Hypoxylon sp. FL1857]